MTDRAFLPYGRQSIGEDDIAEVTAVLRGDWLTTGPAVAAFEDAFAESVGARFAVACSSGTAALHLAALALDLGPDDLVIVPTMTFMATASAVRLAGAEVVFADVDAETGLMTPATLEAAIADLAPDRRARVRAVFPVHFAGQTVDLPAIAAIAEKQGWTIVEDAAHAVGSEYGAGNRVGDCRHGAMATFSFHPVKTITSGEGGMVTTNDPDLAEALRRFRTHGITRRPEDFRSPAAARDARGEINPWYHEVHRIGPNCRLSDIHAALGLAQLRKLPEFAARRRALAARYDARLAPLAPVLRPIGRVPDCRPCWHLYVVRLDFARLYRDRAAVMEALRQKGIGTQVHYIPVHRQPYYQDRYGARDLPGAEAWYRSVLSLPLFPAMAKDDVDRVVGALAEIIA